MIVIDIISTSPDMHYAVYKNFLASNLNLNFYTFLLNTRMCF